MAFHKINRTDANAIFAGDALRAVQLAQQLHSQLVTLNDRMDEMTTEEIQVYHGLPSTAVATAFKEIVNDLRDALEVEEGPADKFRTWLG